MHHSSGVLNLGKGTEMISLALKRNISLPLAAVSFYSLNARRVVLGHSLMQGDRPSVVDLLFRSGPSAIFWLIISTVVWVAINRMAFRALPHISKEIFELEPSVAYTYAPAAIILIGVVVLVSAPLKHLAPRFVFWSLMHCMFGCRFTLQAPTRRTSTVAHASGPCGNVVAAVAPELPENFPSMVAAGKFNSGQASIALTGCHFGELNSISHFDLFDRLLWLGPAGVGSTASGPLLYSTAKGRVLDLFKPKRT